MSVESGCVGVSLFLKQTIKNRNSRNKSLPMSISFTLPQKSAVHFSRKETPRCTRLKGTFTLEAAVILPLTACFFVSILFFFRVMQVQIEVQKALDDTGRRLAVVLTEQETYETAGIAAAKVIFSKELLGRSEVEQYVTGGALGIRLAESELLGEEVCLRAAYSVKLPVRLFWNGELPVIQRAECRKWTGWKPYGEAGDGDTWVYVTQTGTVYHRTRECTHLTLSIRSVPWEELEWLRNENGAKYHACTLCVDKKNKFRRVYITNQGDCYHTDLNCSGIKRTIFMIRLSEVGGRRACSKCGNK